ncbi:MAG: GTP-binding protein, partial [Lachnospiraceae bacterium]|nr:GTP-binding protein [Lachnospiraceae bacterium]
MKKVVIGILAHVDAGKTTLSEALLYETGSIRKEGSVDVGTSLLDYDPVEAERGITVFSSQAELTFRDLKLSLLDTPGHVDFSGEMERTLSVLDYAILLISGPAGVQSHTRTLWDLLEKYRLPVVIFVNKMDIAKD